MKSDRASLSTILASLGLSAAALVATVFAARDLALDRLVGDWGGVETRTQNLGDYVRMATDFMPFGSGAGSFDPVYRIYEPAAALRPNFLNHAHNDLAQLAIEYGVPGLLLLAGLLSWWVWRSWRAWSPSGMRPDRADRLGAHRSHPHREHRRLSAADADPRRYAGHRDLLRSAYVAECALGTCHRFV